jgi:P4 family phage/plasmid primase-like protien
MTTGNDYMEFDDDDECIEDIYEFMEKIFPKPNVREYVFTLLASFLLGITIDQKFHVWTGKGGNGKSKLIELFELAFGQYCVKLPVSLLTQKRGASGAACPELARTKGARFASMQEPDENERLNIGLMKEVSGGDVRCVRALYKEPVEFKPQFKLALCCNHLPKVPPDDDGTWRRIRVVEFIAKFTDTPDPTKPYEHPKDYQLDEKIVRWKEGFLFILLQYYEKYKTDGITEPEEVKQATRDYQRMSDIYVEFIDDTIVKDQTSIIKLDDTYGHFKVWYRLSFDGKCPSRRDFKIGMEKKFGKYQAGNKGGWVGYRFIPQTDDNENNTNTIPSGLITIDDEPDTNTNTNTNTNTDNTSMNIENANASTNTPSMLKKVIHKIAKKPM